MLRTSFFRMRIDLPSERAATGSFADPNSTMITIATIRIFHGAVEQVTKIHVRPLSHRDESRANETRHSAESTRQVASS